MNNKKNLTQLINEKGVQFESNNLILAPLGSGKTEFISKLASNTKSLIITPDGDMTYEKFGELIKYDNAFAEQYETIICDDVHTLYEPKSFISNINLIHTIKFLFDLHEGTQIYYLTSTDKSLNKMIENGDGSLDKVTVYDFMNESQLVKYAEKSIHSVNHIDQIEAHLESNADSFRYFENKAFIYTKTTRNQKKVAKMVENLGLTPLIVANEKQLKKSCDVLITDNLNLTLNDKNIQIVIIDTADETEFIKARCMIKQNIDYLVKIVEIETDKTEGNIQLADYWLNTNLTTKMKTELCKEISEHHGYSVPLKWTTTKKLLIDSGYKIDDLNVNLKNKRTRVSMITKA